MNKYRDIMEEIHIVLLEIEGKVLIDFIVHVVEPEINIAYLVFTDSIYATNGAIGSEILIITKVKDNSIPFEKTELRRFEPYSMFYNKK